MAKASNGELDDKSGSRIDAIYQALFQAILAQELMPGTKLSEESIGSLFSVSRTIVRAALNRLHTESLVEFRQNRGAFVASTTPEEARQVFEARNAIEREIFSKLATVITDKQIAALEAHLDKEHKVSDAHDHAAAILLSGEFHLLAARMAGNEVLAGFLKSLISRTSLILAQHSTHQESDCSVDEHAAVLAALRARDSKAAGTAIVEHLQQVFERANIGQTKRTERNLSEILARYA
ncbi:GntR family transcriptional regulator [Youhaiella tibetensis]|uniref:GntR family transcriptional regulator n=1 Tax=Paradevosia tibetensis TaxID=1447062 RepID=A0A5B9DMQ8_9HYPH|nr:GntR family transcriptional regulator [Youhaiella tibetensis]AKR55005.1 GntR family transcriptional regulator [Devosia sp. H5989]QEE20114.1 GntR family transcriptional regulator [Youhaiella tibetensis]GGF27052.1 GntR family transcriptional regulator [Youhaiella tibetensis]